MDTNFNFSTQDMIFAETQRRHQMDIISNSEFKKWMQMERIDFCERKVIDSNLVKAVKAVKAAVSKCLRAIADKLDETTEKTITIARA